MRVSVLPEAERKELFTAPKTTFGWELVMDLYGCNRDTISNREEIGRFASELCEVLGMKAYGKPMTPYFGENQEHTKGYSLLQFIETSSIVGHFSENTGAAYINIFSCKEYDVKSAENFVKNFFGAERTHSRFIIRE